MEVIYLLIQLSRHFSLMKNYCHSQDLTSSLNLDPGVHQLFQLSLLDCSSDLSKLILVHSLITVHSHYFNKTKRFQK